LPHPDAQGKFFQNACREDFKPGPLRASKPGQHSNVAGARIRSRWARRYTWRPAATRTGGSEARCRRLPNAANRRRDDVPRPAQTPISGPLNGSNGVHFCSHTGPGLNAHGPGWLATQRFFQNDGFLKNDRRPPARKILHHFFLALFEFDSILN